MSNFFVPVRGKKRNASSSKTSSSGRRSRNQFGDSSTRKKQRTEKTRQAIKDSDSDDGDEYVDDTPIHDFAALGDTSGFSSSSSTDEDEAESRAETADEKKVRLAHDFLTKFRKANVLLDDSGESSSSDDDDQSRRETAKLLRQQMLQQQGRGFVHVAQKLENANASSEITQLSQLSGYRRHRGHKLSITCVALSKDDQTLFSGSKDCTLIQWDVETGKKLHRYVGSRRGVFSESDGRTPAGHKGQVMSVAVSPDKRFLASGGEDSFVHIWDTRSHTLVHSFKGHRDTVSALAFRQIQSPATELFSASHDRTVKLWDIDELAYIETLFGHQAEITSIDALQQRRAVTSSVDRTVRLWKVDAQSQLVFRGKQTASIDTISMLSENSFVSGSQDGSIALWTATNKKPIQMRKIAHTGISYYQHRLSSNSLSSNSLSSNSSSSNSSSSSSSSSNSSSSTTNLEATPFWISSLKALANSDLAASGSNDGHLRFWHCNSHTKKLKQIHSVPINGFVNGLAFSSNAKFVVAGVGQEHRLGRWWRVPKVRNAIHIIPLTHDE